MNKPKIEVQDRVNADHITIEFDVDTKIRITVMGDRLIVNSTYSIGDLMVKPTAANEIVIRLI